MFEVVSVPAHSSQTPAGAEFSPCLYKLLPSTLASESHGFDTTEGRWVNETSVIGVSVLLKATY